MLEKSLKKLSVEPEKKERFMRSFSDDILVTKTNQNKPRIHSDGFFYIKDSKEGKSTEDTKVHYFKCEQLRQSRHCIELE